jgi:osmoprotectant transport system ATP-binding protein
MLDPEFLLLDEPLGALDPMIRYELQKELKVIFETLHKTVILVTHDLAEAVHFGDELVLMRAGKIIQRGTLQQLLSAPAEPFVEEFVRAQQEPLQKLHSILL